MDEFNLDIDNLFSRAFEGPPKNKKEKNIDEVRSRGYIVNVRHELRRCFSESKLREILPNNLAQGSAYHVISGGDIDSLSFIKHIISDQDLKYLILSTWCMATEDIVQLIDWINLRKLLKLDCYVGEIFPGSYTQQYIELCKLAIRVDGRVGVFRNHSKVFVGFGKKYNFVIESSANINTNPRAENTVITLDDGLCLFYKNYFDGIISFEKNFPEWNPVKL